MSEWMQSDAAIPLEFAVCVHKEHPRRRTVLNKTALGEGKKSSMFKMMGENVDDLPLDHRQLQMALYDLGIRMVREARQLGYEFVGRGIFGYGPYPAYVKGVTQFAGARVAPTNKEADRVIQEARIRTDGIVYRVAGEFMPSREGIELPEELSRKRFRESLP